jgi:hypothetical protein
VARPLTPGAARMLGFAALDGAWTLFVDADVEVEPAWVDDALARVALPDAPAALWGRLEEWFVDGDRVRAGVPDLYKVGATERATDYVATLAFYRRAALLEAGGYDARLSSEEDFELGLRFRHLGLAMRSTGTLAGRHWSAPRPSFAELARRWNRGLLFGHGQALRLYLGRRGFGALLRRQALYLAMLAFVAAGAVAAALRLGGAAGGPLVAWALALALAWAAMAVRKRSARLGAHALLSWTLLGLGLVIGFAMPPRAVDA